jgi:hypothetical protein
MRIDNRVMRVSYNVLRVGGAFTIFDTRTTIHDASLMIYPL